MKRTIGLLFLLIFIPKINAQEYFPNNESVQNKNDNYTAFINARIIVTPTQIIDEATLLIQNGKVVSVGKSVAIPKNTVTIDLKGKSIYPSFIDMYTTFGVDKLAKTDHNRQDQIYDTKREGYYWNEHIKTELNAFNNFKYDKSKAEELLKAGFGIVGTHSDDGVAQGTGSLIALNNEDQYKRLLADKITNHFSFSRSQNSIQAYPNSLMGMMALLRQMYYDLDWYKKGNATTQDLSLEALIKNEKLVQIFASEDKLNSLRAAKIAKEFGLNYILKGSGNEYERINDIKNTNARFIIPIDFPKAYDVTNPYQASQLDYAELLTWNQAPTNLKVLTDNGIIFALTTDKLKKIEDFRTNLLKAIQYGFDKTKALEALTTVPASLLGKNDEIGKLSQGYLANFLITSGDIFEKESIIYENWVQGSKFVINDIKAKDIRGDYDLTFDNKTYKWIIKGEIVSPKSEIKTRADDKITSKVAISNNWVSLVLQTTDSTKTNFDRLSGYIDDSPNLTGKAVLFDGRELTWNAIRTTPFVKEIDASKIDEINNIIPTMLPNIAFGNFEKPKQQTLLFKNATVWTNEKEGILNETDVLIKNGKIAAIGANLSDAAAIVIDSKGKHLTSGIIDEHSHIAISNGVNESGHNSTAEVTIEDVVKSDDINIYRDLAGGVTTSQLLHGSANPIGGRSAIVKWKWGSSPEEMLYKKQPKFIKFALGENVKQANWGLANPTRFPQTRMGVEQVYIDYFQRAKDYDENWKNYNASSKKNKGKAPRIDLELQTLAEILNKERFITCHSYVASEILMLMNVADKFKFNVNTYTHILEGYKVADKMKEHGVGASTFSDWWAYKFEVNDAIPYNGAIMHNAGVVVAYNSDDAEMSRRLNQEAAKAVKYGNLSEEDAWKFVTLNPAKLLHIDDKVGSIKVGKDADVVLWSTNPLSVYAKVEKTIIEGVTYYDSEKDIEQRKLVAATRGQIIDQMLDKKNKGQNTKEPKKIDKIEYHCDTLEL